MVLQQQLVPLAGGECRDVEGTVLMIVAEQGKEVLVVVGGVARIREGYLSEHVVPVEDLMVQIVSKCRVSSSLEESTEKKSQGPHPYIL